jgi:hypothetical protein
MSLTGKVLVPLVLVLVAVNLALVVLWMSGSS